MKKILFRLFLRFWVSEDFLKMEAIVNFEPCHIFLVSAFFSFRVKIKSEALFCCHSKWRRLVSREDFSIVQNDQRLGRIHDSITEVMAMTLLGAVANYCWERKQTKTLWSQVRPTPARCGQSFFKAKFLSNCSRLWDRLSSSDEVAGMGSNIKLLWDSAECL